MLHIYTSMHLPMLDIFVFSAGDGREQRHGVAVLGLASGQRCSCRAERRRWRQSTAFVSVRTFAFNTFLPFFNCVHVVCEIFQRQRISQQRRRRREWTDAAQPQRQHARSNARTYFLFFRPCLYIFSVVIRLWMFISCEPRFDNFENCAWKILCVYMYVLGVSI